MSRFNPRELGTYVALKVLEQHLDPTLATAYPSSGTSRPNAVIGSAIPMSASSHRGSVASSSAPVTLPPSINSPLPEFYLPRSFSTDLPNNLTFFRSTLPQPNDEVQAYPSSRESPRRECVLKVTTDRILLEALIV